MKESYYKIMKNKLLLTDQRFDGYRQESMNLFLDIQAEIGFDNSVNYQEKDIFSKLSQQLALTEEEYFTLEKMSKRFSESNEKMNKLGLVMQQLSKLRKYS
jgi:hypothetical protein